MLAMVILVFGFDELMQRELARGIVPKASILATAVRARVQTCMAMTVVGLASAALVFWLVPGPLAWSILWMTGATVCVLVSNFVVNIALATYTVGVPLAASLISWLIPLLAVAIVGVDDSTQYFIFIFIGAASRLIISTAWYFYTQLRSSGRAAHGVTRSSLLSSPQEHASLTLNLLATQVLGRYGDVIVAAVLAVPLGMIAAYSLAFQITATTNTFLMIGLGAIALTQFSTASNEATRLGARWRSFSKLATMVSFGPFASLAILSPVALPLLFGDEYDGIVGLTLALLCAQWINRICGGGTNIGALIALGKSRSVAKSSLIGAAINIAGNLLLIPILGAYGMAAATAASVATVGIWNTLAIRRATETSPPWRFLALVTILLGAVVLVSVMPLELYIRIGFLGVVAVPWLVLTIRAWVRKDTWT